MVRGRLVRNKTNWRTKNKIISKHERIDIITKAMLKTRKRKEQKQKQNSTLLQSLQSSTLPLILHRRNFLKMALRPRFFSSPVLALSRFSCRSLRCFSSAVAAALGPLDADAVAFAAVTVGATGWPLLEPRDSLVSRPRGIGGAAGADACEEEPRPTSALWRR